MAEYKSKYTLKDKQAAVRDAIRRMEPVHEHWQMLEALYRTGAQRELTQLDLNRILPFPIPGTFMRTVNMLLPHLTLIINSVSARDPKFVITPMGGNPAVVEQNGVIAKAVLDYFWKRADATSVLRDMTQDMVIVGNAFAKVGWSYSAETRDRTNEEISIDTNEILTAASELSTEYGVSLTEADISEMLDAVQLTEQLVESDEPFVEYVSPYDMFLPADARRMNQTRWVCQRVRLPKDELEASELFDRKAVEDLKTDTAYADEATRNMYETHDQTLPSVFSYVTVYEFYDMRDRTLCIFQLDAERPLFEGPIPYAHRYPPFVHMRNFSDGGSTIWGFGDVENVAGIQLMINEIMIAEINDLKRVGNKYFINKKVLTPELSKALSSSTPDAVIPIDLPANVGMQEVLQPVQRMATPADNFVMEAKLQEYTQRILGVSDLQIGAMSSASRVPATAAAAVEGATTTRAMEKMVSVEKTSREIGTRVLALCQQFLDEGKAIRIAGPNAPTWLQVSAEDIDGEFSVEAEGGSTQAINPATRARQGLEMLTNVVPALAQLGYNPENAVRTALTYMGLNPDHLLVRPEPQPAPAQPGVPPVQGPEAAAGGIPPELMALITQNQTSGAMPPGAPVPVSPEMNSPMMQDLAALGGPPVPAAGEGEVII